MRKILFRGKRMDNGEWILGSLLKVKTNSYALQTAYMIFKPDFVFTSEGAKSLGHAHVDPETVGQCTGLKDRNGKWIFEGDMLKPFDDEIDKMVVEFHNGLFMLCLYGERGYMGEGGWVEEGNYGVFECEPLSSYGDDVEVIGNIHDNPELLGGEQNE